MAWLTGMHRIMLHHVFLTGGLVGFSDAALLAGGLMSCSSPSVPWDLTIGKSNKDEFGFLPITSLHSGPSFAAAARYGRVLAVVFLGGSADWIARQ